MNTRKWVSLASVLGLVVLGIAIWTRGRPTRQPPVVTMVPIEQPNPTITLPPSALPAPEPTNAKESTDLPPRPPPVHVSAESPSSPGRVVRVKSDQVLATVNDVTLTLKDLMPLTPGKAHIEQSLSAERYGFLLNRAIEREVAVQVARAQGVELSATQRKQLEELRARSERVEAGVFDTVQHNPVNTEFEARDATALLLQATMAEKAGVPSPHVTSAQVQQYYQEHQAEYGTLPSDPAQRQMTWEKIDQAIRTRLAPQIQAEHQERLEKFVDDLKSAAKVTTSPPDS